MAKKHLADHLLGICICLELWIYIIYSSMLVQQPRRNTKTFTRLGTSDGVSRPIFAGLGLEGFRSRLGFEDY